VLHLDDTAEVRRVEVAGTAPGYTLEKDGASWKMLAPRKDAAERRRRTAWPRRSIRSRATAIAAESAAGPALKQYGLSQPKITVQLHRGRSRREGQLTGGRWCWANPRPRRARWR